MGTVEQFIVEIRNEPDVPNRFDRDLSAHRFVSNRLNNHCARSALFIMMLLRTAFPKGGPN